MPPRAPDRVPQALEHLADWSLRCREVSPERFLPDLRAAIERQRRHFLAAPVRNALVACARAVTRRTPHLGAIAGQRRAARQIEALTRRRGV